MKKENVSQIILGIISGFIFFLFIFFIVQWIWFINFFYYAILSLTILFLTKVHSRYTNFYLALGISIVMFSLFFALIFGTNFEIGGW